MFGAERAGLETADLALANAIVTIPVDPRFHSLNLAQAVSITAYEWRLTVMDAAPKKFLGVAEPATQAAMIGLYEQLEGELDKRRLLLPAGEQALDGAQSARGPGAGAVHRPGGAHVSAA